MLRFYVPLTVHSEGSQHRCVKASICLGDGDPGTYWTSSLETQAHPGVPGSCRSCDEEADLFQNGVLEEMGFD